MATMSIAVTSPVVKDSTLSSLNAEFSGVRCSAPSTSLCTAGRRQNLSAFKLNVSAATTVATKFTTLKPLGDRVLVKISTKEEKTLGGIYLPSAAQTKPQGGEVVAVGEGRSIGEKKVAISITEGSSVVYAKYAGTEVEFNGAQHLILKEDDIIGTLSSDDIKDLQPLNERVLIKPIKGEKETAGGVLLTENEKEKPIVGEVISTGPGPLGEDGNRKGLDVSPGNTVLYSKFAGSEFKGKDDTPYVVLRSTDILAILS